MRKFFSVLSVTSLLLIITTSYSLAETNQGNTKREEVKNMLEQKRLEREELKVEIKDKVQEKRDDLQIKKASVEAKIAELRNKRLIEYWDHMQTRLLALVDRLDNITQRINNRISKIEETSSEDLSSIKSQVAEAQAKIDHAQTKIDDINANLDSTLNSSNPKTAFKTLIQDIKSVRDDLVEAHRILVHVIGNIKGLKVGQTEDTSEPITPTLSPEPTATLTPTLTPTPTPTLTPTPSI